MLTLHKLVSKGIQEAISVLEGSRKQSADAYSIGSTVQPVVNVNNGVVKYFIIDFAGNAFYSIDVPKGKIWKFNKGILKIDTDATVANRYPYLRVYPSYSSSIFIYSVSRDTAVTASQTGILCPINNAGLNETSGKSSSFNEVKLFGGDTVVFGITSGVAGDALHVIIEFLEFDVC